MNRRRHIRPKKKTIFLFFFLLLIIILIIIQIIKPKNHNESYQIKKYQINIKYNAKSKLYTIDISKNNIRYLYEHDGKYHKQIISDLKIIEDETTKCIKPKSSLSLEPFCINENGLINANLVSNELKAKLGYQDDNKKIVKNQKITTYNLLNKDYYLWNYHGFTLINKNTFKDIRLFKNDTYSANLITSLDRYLLVADYDSSYNFKKFIVYDMKKHNDESFKVNKDISFNSEILGTSKKSVYLIDKKYEREWEIVPEYEKARTLKTPVYLSNNKLKNTKIKKLINNEVNWDKGYITKYFLKDKKLYMTYDYTNEIQVSNLEIDRIMSQDNYGVYYLVGDTLYHYDGINMETKVLTYTEWQFNPSINIIIY